MKKLKGNGFTLVELLAVIVILAILVLVATPAVTSIMQKSQKNALKNEVLSLVKDMDRAFTEKSGKKILAQTSYSNTGDNATSIYNVSVGGVKYKYLCMTLSQLVSEQYTKKDLTNYSGFIQMWVPDLSGETITFVDVSNTSFFLQGKYSIITKSDHLPTQTSTGAAPYNDLTKCPSSIDQIPGDGVKNS